MAVVLGKLPTNIERDLQSNPILDTDDGILENFYKGVVKQFLSVGKGITGTVESGVELFAGENQFLSGVTQNIREAQAGFETLPSNAVEWVASIVGQAVPYMATAAVGGSAGGFLGGKAGQWIGAASVGFAVEGQDAYDEAKKRGATETQAETERLLVGGINAFIEASQASKILRLKDTGKASLKSVINRVRNKAYSKIAGDVRRLTGDVLRTSVNEAFEEMLQEGVSISIPGFVEGKTALPLDAHGNIDFASIAARLSTAALAGGIASPIVGSAASILPGRGFAGLSSNFGMPTAEQIDDGIAKIKASSLSTSAKDDAIAQLTGARNIVEPPEEIEIPEGVVADPTLSSRLIEKLKQLNDVVRPISEAQIKREQGIRSGEYRNNYEEFVHAGMNENVAELAARGVLTGQMVANFPALLQDGFTAEDFNFLQGEARNSTFYKNYELVRVNDALRKLFEEGRLPEPAEIKLLEPLLGQSVTKELTNLKKKTRSISQRAVSELLDVANIPRAILASWDFSAPGRQGALLFFQNPKAWAKGLWSGYRAFVNEGYANFKNLQLKTNDFYSLAKKSGLVETEIGGVNSEEPFASRLAEEVPLVKRSERAYVTSLNTMRFEAFYRIVEDWAGTAKTQKDYDDLAKILNHLTGRGNLGALEKLAPALNVAFFSPRLQMARIQTFTDLARVDSPSRKILAWTLVKAFGTGSLILALLKWYSKKNKDISVELNPKSSDFGKIRIGNTRIDYWAGYSQLMRGIAQFVSGEVKSTQTKELFNDERLSIFGRFLQTKLSPAAGLALDVYRGEDFKGDIVSRENLGEQFYNRFTPLFIQDVVDAARFQGLDGVLLTAPLASHGIGAMSYPESESGKSTRLKNSFAKEVFGVNWTDLGPDFQNALRENFPLIGWQEEKARAAKLTKQADVRFLNEQRKSERLIRKQLGKEITDPLDRLFVNLGGVSRRIGSNWYLNDSRYREYRIRVADALKKILPRVLNTSAPDMVKRLLVEDIVDRVKKNVRQQLMAKATIEDLRRGT